MQDNIHILVKQPLSDLMGSSIETLIDVLQFFHDAKTDDKVVLNLSSLSFVHPFLILPISALIKHLENKKIDVSIIYPKNITCKDYLSKICFADGLNPIADVNWEIKLTQYQTKTYLPIIAVPMKNHNEQVKNKILAVFEQIMQNQLKLDINLYTAIKYITGEAFDNIDQHANVDNGWIMVQSYPSKEYLDVCIL